MRKARVIMVAAGVCGVIFAAGGATAALASIPGTTGVIHGCYRTAGPHTLSVIDGQTCPSGSTPLSWNQKGPAGPGSYTQPAYSPGNSQDVAPGAMVSVTATCPVISGTTGYATGGGVVTYNGPASSDPSLHAPDLRMIDSYPSPGSAARNYNTGWTATMTNESTSQTESFQTWAMCQYAS